MTITVRIDAPAEGDPYETHPAVIRPLHDVADAAAVYLAAEAEAQRRKNHAARSKAAKALGDLARALDALTATKAVARQLKAADELIAMGQELMGDEY